MTLFNRFQCARKIKVDLLRQFNDSTLIEKVELNCGRRRVSLDDGKGRRWRDYLNLLFSVAFG